jgi:hypothetical protein
VLSPLRSGRSEPRILESLPFDLVINRFALAAEALSSSLQKQSRADGSSFLALASGSPEWMRDAVREAHLGELPNDSRFELISSLAEALSHCDEENAREESWEIALSATPSFTGELLQWFAAHPSRLSDCDENLERYLSGHGGEFSGTFELLSNGYTYSAEHSLFSLIDSLANAPFFNPDTDCKLLFSDANGIHIPKLWADELSEEEAEDFGVDWQDVLTCQDGPDAEGYWEAWQAILDSAEWEEDGRMWRLVQNGDLWAVDADAEIPDTWF